MGHVMYKRRDSAQSSEFLRFFYEIYFCLVISNTKLYNLCKFIRILLPRCTSSVKNEEEKDLARSTRNSQSKEFICTSGVENFKIDKQNGLARPSRIKMIKIAEQKGKVRLSVVKKAKIAVTIEFRVHPD